jgi:hypothetical protein
MMKEFAEAATTAATQLNATPTSKLARQIARQILGGPSDDLHIDAIIIDSALVEVREVLRLVADGNFNQAEVINRARALYEKLEQK